MDGSMSPFPSPSGIRKSEHVVHEHEHEHESTPAPSSLAQQIAYGIVSFNSRQAAHSRPWRSGMSVSNPEAQAHVKAQKKSV